MPAPAGLAGRPRRPPRRTDPSDQPYPPSPEGALMSQVPGAEQDQGRYAAPLTLLARQVHLAVLESFAGTGRPPPRAELERVARGQGADPGAVLAELAGRDVLA